MFLTVYVSSSNNNDKCGNNNFDSYTKSSLPMHDWMKKRYKLRALKRNNQRGVEQCNVVIACNDNIIKNIRQKKNGLIKLNNRLKRRKNRLTMAMTFVVNFSMSASCGFLERQLFNYFIQNVNSFSLILNQGDFVNFNI